MRNFLVGSGVPAQSIAIETSSESTRGNAVAVALLLRQDPGTKLLLTSDYHMFRASRAFAKAGVRVRPRPNSRRPQTCC